MTKRMASPYGAVVHPYPPPVFFDVRITQVPLIGEGGWLETLTDNDPVQEEAQMPQKPDPVNARNEDKPFPVHPEGQFAARCVDVIDLGESVSSFPGTQPYIAQKVALAFWTGETDPNPEVKQDGPVTVVMEFTLSMGEKANLRKFLQSWRGKAYTDEQAKEGVPVDKLYGAAALVSVEQFTSKAGRKYARISSIAPLPKQMASAVPVVEQIAYERDEWWGKKKEQYAKEAAEFRAKSRPASAKKSDDFEGFPDEVAGDDDLPF
jgi:hypothetical protein